MAPLSLQVRHFALILNLKMNLKPLVALSAFFFSLSCDSDAEDELLAGLVDNPGTTRGTKLSVLQMMVFPSLVNRGF